jgi:hypothetical protein
MSPAIRELLDRGYGKATQPLAGETGAAPIVLHVTDVTERELDL